MFEFFFLWTTGESLQPHPIFRGTEKYPIPKRLLQGHLGKLPHIISGNRTISSLYLLLGKQKEALFSSLIVKPPTTLAELTTPAYQPTPWASHLGGNPKPAPPTLPAAPPSTATAASHPAPPPTELSAADFEALFNEIIELYSRQGTPRKVPESLIKETPEKPTPEEP